MKTILLSRTDKIGDVILTLPMAGMLKKHLPNCKVFFLASRYTMAVADKCEDLDAVYDWTRISEGVESLPQIDYFIHVFPDAGISKFAKKKNIGHRIGTSHRLHHWPTCNHLVHFTRKRSELHESQLNLRLLKPLGIDEIPAISEMHHYVNWRKTAQSEPAGKLASRKFKLVFHMKSMGSAKEWPLANYLKLARELPPGRFQIFITGTLLEGNAIKAEQPELFELPNVTDVTGCFSLKSFIAFIEQCDGLLACSTGPLHVASIAGIKTLGLYPAEKPIHAKRWAPIGENGQTLSEKASRKKTSFLTIEVSDVKKIISSWGQSTIQS